MDVQMKVDEELLHRFPVVDMKNASEYWSLSDIGRFEITDLIQLFAQNHSHETHPPNSQVGIAPCRRAPTDTLVWDTHSPTEAAGRNAQKIEGLAKGRIMSDVPLAHGDRSVRM